MRDSNHNSAQLCTLSPHCTHTACNKKAATSARFLTVLPSRQEGAICLARPLVDDSLETALRANEDTSIWVKADRSASICSPCDWTKRKLFGRKVEHMQTRWTMRHQEHIAAHNWSFSATYHVNARCGRPLLLLAGRAGTNVGHTGRLLGCWRARTSVSSDVETG